MSLLRFLGLGGASAAKPDEPRETETVRRIAAQLERLEPNAAKYLAAFAYVLARVAHADLEIDQQESRTMERLLRNVAHLSPEETTLVVEIAKSQTRLLGGTENYVVTREFRSISTREQRGQLVQCVYAVAAADGSISAEESAEIAKITDELGFSRSEANAIRAQYKDKLSLFQKGKNG